MKLKEPGRSTFFFSFLNRAFLAVEKADKYAFWLSPCLKKESLVALHGLSAKKTSASRIFKSGCRG